MDSEELLAQLADIHLPEPVSFWPPAPGWWLLLVALLIVLAALTHKGRKVLHAKRLRNSALAELEKCYQSYLLAMGNTDNTLTDNQITLHFVNEYNSVLRRVALWHFPMDNVAGLSGVQWVSFIRNNGNSAHLTEEIADALSSGRFKTELHVDGDAMVLLGRSWIDSLYRRKPEKATEFQGANHA